MKPKKWNFNVISSKYWFFFDNYSLLTRQIEDIFGERRISTHVKSGKETAAGVRTGGL